MLLCKRLKRSSPPAGSPLVVRGTVATCWSTDRTFFPAVTNCCWWTLPPPGAAVPEKGPPGRPRHEAGARRLRLHRDLGWCTDVMHLRPLQASMPRQARRAAHPDPWAVGGGRAAPRPPAAGRRGDEADTGLVGACATCCTTSSTRPPIRSFTSRFALGTMPRRAAADQPERAAAGSASRSRGRYSPPKLSQRAGSGSRYWLRNCPLTQCRLTLSRRAEKRAVWTMRRSPASLKTRAEGLRLEPATGAEPKPSRWPAQDGAGGFPPRRGGRAGRGARVGPAASGW